MGDVHTYSYLLSSRGEEENNRVDFNTLLLRMVNDKKLRGAGVREEL